MGKRCDLQPCIDGARSHGASISETAALLKFIRAGVLKLFKDWTVSRKTGSERASCGHQRLVNERREETLGVDVVMVTYKRNH